MNPGQLQRILGLSPRLAANWAPLISKALELSECTTPKRKASWLAQVGHESGCLRYTKELWGPTSQQKRYEPPTQLAGRLGNTHPGDGELYKGRGLIQVTGRANYRMCAERMGHVLQGAEAPDFEEHPELLERPDWAALSAALYWKVRGLNRFADAGDFTGLTKAINGGYNGLAHRQHLFIAAIGELS